MVFRIKQSIFTAFIGLSVFFFPLVSLQGDYNQIIKVGNGSDTALNIAGISGPCAIAFYGNQAFVCNLVAKSISVINTTTDELVVTIQEESLLTEPYNIAIDPTLKKAYVCNRDSNGICVISNLDTGVYSFSKLNVAARNIAIDTTAHIAYTCSYTKAINKIDLMNDTVMTSIQLTSMYKPHVIVLSADKTKVYVGGSSSWGTDPLGYTIYGPALISLDTNLANQHDIDLSGAPTPLYFGIRGIGVFGNKLYVCCGKVLLVTNDVYVKDIPFFGKNAYAIGIKSNADMYVVDFGFNIPYSFPPSAQCPAGSTSIREGNGTGRSVGVGSAYGEAIGDTIGGFNSPQAIGVLDDTYIYVCNGSPLRTRCNAIKTSPSPVSSMFSKKKGLYSPK